MIVEWVMGAFLRGLGGVFGALPTFTLPAWLTGSGPGTLNEAMRGLATSMAKWDAWFPGHEALIAIGLLGPIMLVALGIRITRMVLSFFSGGGGSAT